MSLLLFFSASFLQAGDWQNTWVEWDSPRAAERLSSSDANDQAFKLLRFFEGQIHPLYCGVASSVVALNALSVKSPECSRIGSFSLFTQTGFVAKVAERVVGKNTIEKGGLSFNQLTAILKTLPIKVNQYQALSMSDARLREQLLHSLQNPHQIVLANFERSQINQRGSGHWSPVAAYDSKSDSFLVLDVARFKYPPYWVKADALFKAMRTINGRGQSRGFLTIQKSFS